MLKSVELVKLKTANNDEGLEEGQFTAYASVFDVKDSYGDVVRKGAFAESLKEWTKSSNSLPVLYGHDFEDPFSNIGVVLEAKEDDRGLWVKGQIDLDEPKAAKVYKLLKGGRLSQLSFAYDVLEGAFVHAEQSKAAGEEELGDYYELRKLKLYEVSLVPIGANQETEVLSVKHAADALKAGRTISAENEKSLREAIEKIQSVLPQEPSDAEKSKANSQEPMNPESPADDGQSDPQEKSMPKLSVETEARLMLAQII